MNEQTRQFLEKLLARIIAAQKALGSQVVMDTRAEVAMPFPPASEPNTPPHLRTGGLQDGISSQVTVHNEKHVLLTIVSEREDGNPMVPVFLEFGTQKMAPRPYMTPHMDALSDTALDRTAELLGKPL